MIDRGRRLLTASKLVRALTVGLVAGVLGFPAAARADYGFPLIASYTGEQIGANAATYYCVQGADGILYFGSNGLLTFDGERWANFTAPALQSVYGLDVGPDGRVWVAAEGEIGWFERRPDARWRYVSLRGAPGAGAVRGQIWKVFSNGDRATFVGSERVYLWNRNHFETLEMAGGRRLNAFRIGGQTYVYYSRQGVLRLGDGEPELCIPQRLIGPPDAGVLWIDSESENGWMIATSTGLVRVRNGRREAFAPEVSRILREGTLTCGVRLPDHRYAFGTLKRGIVVMRADGSVAELLDEAAGVPVPYITSLMCDREGALWATSQSRVLRISLDPASRVFDERAGLPSQFYRWIASADGTVITGSTAALYRLADDQHFVRTHPLQGVHDISPSADGPIIAGFKGAQRLHAGAFETIRESLYDVQTAQPSRLWPGELLLSEDPDPSIVSLAPNGAVRKLVHNLPVAATSLAEDETGTIWIGTATRGVFLARPQGAAPVDPVRPAERVQLPMTEGGSCVRAAEDGSVLIFCGSGGWIKTRGAEVFQPIRNFPSRPLAAAGFVTGGELWVALAATDSSAACVGRISISARSASWTPHSVLGLETIGTPQSVYAETDRQGHTVLWLGGTRCVLRHVVGSAPYAPTPERPLIHGYSEADQPGTRTPIAGPLPYETRAIDFEFAEPQYARRALLRLESRLDGVDNDWIPAGRDSRRELTAMREGQYTLRLRAVAETGIVSEPAVLAFTIAPPWWRTRTAAASAALALGLLGYLVYRLRVRSLHRRNALLEQRVRERTEELAEASAAKTMFVANMSHDIRNPLNGIIGLALAMEDTPLNGRQKELVSTLRECTTYLSSLVDDVLDFASIEAGKIELHPGPYIPIELLHSTVAALKAEAASLGAEVAVQLGSEVPPMLEGDAGRIQQVLVNYLSNALKYAGGRIVVSALVPTTAPGEIEFAVRDNGPGLSEREQAALFTKFSRLQNARGTGIRGTGLGLAACRHLADLMGGSVGVQSEPGEGSMFYLRLPMVIAAGPVVRPADIVLPRTTILLVEDTDYNALAATAVLARLGLTCDRASTGGEALQMFAEKRHNVVLLDRNLPDMDGTQVAQRLREIETDGCRAVLLAVTAYCTAEDRAMCMSSGMDAFVGKPLTPEKMRKVFIDIARRLITATPVNTVSPVKDLPPSPDETPDTTLLGYLSDGTEQGLAAQIERFLTELAAARAALTAVQRNNDPKSTGDAVHRLVGQARMVNASRLAEILLNVEASARDNDAARFAKLLADADAAIARLTAALRRRPGAQKA